MTGYPNLAWKKEEMVRRMDCLTEFGDPGKKILQMSGPGYNDL